MNNEIIVPSGLKVTPKYENKCEVYFIHGDEARKDDVKEIILIFPNLPWNWDYKIKYVFHTSELDSDYYIPLYLEVPEEEIYATKEEAVTVLRERYLKKIEELSRG